MYWYTGLVDRTKGGQRTSKFGIYSVCSYFFYFQAAVLSSPSGQKALQPGRIVTLKATKGYKLLSLILHIESGSSGQTMSDRKVSVLAIADTQSKGKGLLVFRLSALNLVFF